MKAKNVIDHYAPQHEEMADYPCFANESIMTKVAEFARNRAKTFSNRNWPGRDDLCQESRITLP
jgi:hypothetical protein